MSNRDFFRSTAKTFSIVVRLAVPVFVLSIACADTVDGSVEVVIAGPHSIAVGETATLEVRTENGTDHDYDWSSSDEEVATVDRDGTITGVADGYALITAKGEDTEASGEHVVVVSATDDGDSGTDTDGTDGSGGPDVPNYEKWAMSPHADATAEAFNHWNEDGEIPTSCARCHSQTGYRDYLGDDQSEVGVVNQPAPVGELVDCETCHNPAAEALDSVQFPSGAVVTGLGPEARCMTCHQGRGSTDQVNEVILASGAADDQVSGDLSFQNIHYYPAGATLYAGQARGGYQYESQVYDRRFRHVPEYDSCVGCHDTHSLAVKYDECAECHQGVTDATGVRDIRMIASHGVDYDGDGNTEVGVYFEIKGLEEKLYRAIQRYASEVSGQPICYSSSAYPYWFESRTGANAECTDEEATSGEGFDAWTPRLVRATYNYQMARKDPAAYVHNNRYIVKLLHDSIVDVNEAITNPIDMSQADRDAPGHFNGAGEAARHWDEDEEVSASCSQCHGGAPGFRFYVQYGVGLDVPETSNGLECFTCHNQFGDSYELIDVASTTYPGGQSVEHAGYDNICATCHSGRASKATIDSAIARGQMRFMNVHNLPAAGVRNGSLSHVGYEYEGKTYEGFLQHDSRTQCAGCHEPVASNHTFLVENVWEGTCTTCHNDQSGPQEVRLVHLADYDGDGVTTETLAAELDGLSAALMTAIQAAAGGPICYSGSYPYWLAGTASATGECSGLFIPPSFTAWTPALMKAAHNFQLHHNDPGAYAHNFAYMAQLLFDSIEDLGGDVSGLVRP